MVPRDRTRGNRHRQRHRRVLLNIRKHFFTGRVTEHWHRLPREVAETSSLEILKSWLGMVLDNGCRWPYLRLLIGPDHLQRSFPTSACL